MGKRYQDQHVVTGPPMIPQSWGSLKLVSLLKLLNTRPAITCLSEVQYLFPRQSTTTTGFCLSHQLQTSKSQCVPSLCAPLAPCQPSHKMQTSKSTCSTPAPSPSPPTGYRHRSPTGSSWLLQAPPGSSWVPLALWYASMNFQGSKIQKEGQADHGGLIQLGEVFPSYFASP